MPLFLNKESLENIKDSMIKNVIITPSEREELLHWLEGSKWLIKLTETIDANKVQQDDLYEVNDLLGICDEDS